MPYCRKAAFRQPSSKGLLWATNGKPANSGEMSAQTSGKGAACAVSRYVRPCMRVFQEPVIVGVRPDQAIDLLPDVPVLHPDQPHAANTGAFSVGRFKIDRDEILHKTVKISSQVRCATSAKVRKQSGTVKRGHPFRKRHAAPYRIELHSAWEKSGFMTIFATYPGNSAVCKKIRTFR